MRERRVQGVSCIMLHTLLGSAPARSIDDVLALMNAIDRSLPDDDGLKWFNRLYLRVTERVRAAVTTASFADPAFMGELDVVFANLYFAAIAECDVDITRAPSAWRPVLRARSDRRLIRLQFALAGMNAHINRDLPVGIVQAFESQGGNPLRAAARRRDFDAVNTILERVEAEVKGEFSVGLVGAVDLIAGRIDDVLAMWKVRRARSAAWTNAEVLWTLRRVPRLRDAFFGKLDGLTGFAGRGLLIPTIR
jgi:hypothetical protein